MSLRADRRATVVALGLIAACVLLGAAFVPAERVLVVEDLDTGERLHAEPVENGTSVALEYTHSVEKTRVYDGYTVDGDRLVMTRMEFESYGWGLPADADVTLENGTFVYDPPGATTALTVSPGRIAGHRLHVGERTYDLVEMADGSVRIHVTRRSLLTSLLPV